jgi:hypothetical protein
MCATLGKERVEVGALVSNCKCVLVLAEYRIVVWFLASLLFFCSYIVSFDWKCKKISLSEDL